MESDYTTGEKIIIGILCLGIFIGLYFLIKNKINFEPFQNEEDTKMPPATITDQMKLNFEKLSKFSI